MADFLIDVSEHNGRIDWEAIRPHIDGAIIRCGYGDDYYYQDDDMWLRNVSECERLGIPYGVYLYSYATNAAHAKSEAAHALRLLEGHNPDYPVYFDSEENGTGGVAAECAEIFCSAMEEAGYDAGIYASLSWWHSYLDTSTRWSKWVAAWGTDIPGMECDIWQYSSDGYIQGHPGRLDVNWCYIEPKREDEDEMTDEQIQKLADAIYSNFNDPWSGCDDAKAIWGADGKNKGDGKRNWYNLQRWNYDNLVKINQRLDAIEKKLGAK